MSRILNIILLLGFGVLDKKQQQSIMIDCFVYFLNTNTINKNQNQNEMLNFIKIFEFDLEFIMQKALEKIYKIVSSIYPDKLEQASIIQMLERGNETTQNFCTIKNKNEDIIANRQ